MHHGLDPAFPITDDRETPRNPGAPYMLAVGGVSPRKNTRRLIEAFTRWRGRGGHRSTYRLHITGTSLDTAFDDGAAAQRPG